MTNATTDPLRVGAPFRDASHAELTAISGGLGVFALPAIVGRMLQVLQGGLAPLRVA
ncbi:MAG TPA: hypothetical protein PKC18_08220 [Lacipirellulaceae bacterium]|nr:hypothetical protein [Lacipirellulaceae bacterium]HMP07791.1 hypothetical protein [Lacipirellulaceae bacterium]